MGQKHKVMLQIKRFYPLYGGQFRTTQTCQAWFYVSDFIQLSSLEAAVCQPLHSMLTWYVNINPRVQRGWQGFGHPMKWSVGPEGILTYWWCCTESQVITKVIGIQCLWTVNVFNKFHANPFSRCWDISVWTNRSMDQLTRIQTQLDNLDIWTFSHCARSH